MEEKPQSTNRDSKIRKILDRIIKKLGESYEINGSGTRSNKNTVQQKKKEPTRTKG